MIDGPWCVFVTYLKIIHIFIWNMRLENLSSILCFLLIKLLGTAFAPIVVMGLKHCRDFLRNSIYAGISDGFWRAYQPKCHWNSVEASENLSHLCVPLHCQFKRGGRRGGEEEGNRKALTLDDLCLVTIVMNPVWKPTQFWLESRHADTCQKRKRRKRINSIV